MWPFAISAPFTSSIVVSCLTYLVAELMVFTTLLRTFTSAKNEASLPYPLHSENKKCPLLCIYFDVYDYEDIVHNFALRPRRQRSG
jgi:heme/copper-type cytochrome/quinol oxidase subunit 3